MFMEVKYKAIERFPGYRFGSDGSVWSCWTRGSHPAPTADWRKLKGTPQTYGHLSVFVAGESRLVHRLVLEAFDGPPPPDTECRHLNGDSSDNRIENLKWGTSEENTRDMLEHGRAGLGSQAGRSKLTDDEVLKIMALVRAGESCSRVARQFNVTAANIAAIKNGRSWNHLTGIPRSNVAREAQRRRHAKLREETKLRHSALGDPR